MTTIIRKGNIIASDSLYVVNTGPDKHTTQFFKGKFFILPEKTAIVGISGEVRSEGEFDKVLLDIRNLLAKEYLGLDFEETEDTNKPLIQVLVATKELTMTRHYFVEKDYSIFRDTDGVVIGGGASILHGGKLLDDTTHPLELLELVTRRDRSTNGDFFYFDLNKLADYPKELGS